MFTATTPAFPVAPTGFGGLAGGVPNTNCAGIWMVEEPVIETFRGECGLLSVSTKVPVKVVADSGMKSTT
jgi:hypothetical protein